MKINAYGLIPAEIRYDKNLSSTTKLLYAEITAAVTYEGICEEDIGYFGKVFNCESRTIYRALKELETGNYIMRERINGVKMIKLPSGFRVGSLSDKENITEVPTLDPSIQVFFDEFLDLFEKALGVKLNRKEMYYPMLSDRLERFSRNELATALDNRIKYVISSDWHQRAENKPLVSDITILIKDDNSIHKYLNMRFDKSPEAGGMKPLTFN